MSDRPVLVTGGAGFIGSNLADRLAGLGHNVIVFDALSRAGVEANLAWLQRRHGRHIEAVIADIRDADAVEEAVGRACAVFHFAAQVAVTTSLHDPATDFDVNLRGTFHVLEAARRQKHKPAVIFASTNKVYGCLDDVPLSLEGDAYAPVDARLRTYGIGEDRTLSFHTPYGCSKGAADQYVLEYAHDFGISACVLRMSCVYGPRQFGTEDQGWLAHFLYAVREGRPITLYGDGKQVRDVLFVDDAVDTYLAAWDHIDAVSGRAFNLGGGPENAVTLRQVLTEIARLEEADPQIHFDDWRAGDQRYFVADTRRVRAALGLGPALGWREGLGRLHRWIASRQKSFAEAAS